MMTGEISRDVIRPTYITGLDLVPGNLELMEFEHETPKALSDRKAADRMFFARVAQALATVQDRYDVVVMTARPNLGFSLCRPCVPQPPS